jgi:replicative DNA helicase
MRKFSIDHDYFEYIIALNCTSNEEYIGLIFDKLNIDYIHNKDVKNYLSIIFDFFERNNAIPTPSEIKVYLSENDLKLSFKNVISKFKTLDTEYNFTELIHTTEQYLKESAVYHASLNVATKFTDKEADIKPTEILSLFEEACNVSLTDNLGHDYFNDVDRHIEDLSILENHISTGYEWLDTTLGGGLLENGRALYLFMGPTNSGKSIILGNIANNIIAQNKNVVIISLEMSEMAYARRTSSQISRIPYAELRNETTALKDFLDDYSKNHMGSNLFIKEYAPKSVTTVQISQYIKKLMVKKQLKKIDTLIIDYLTLLAPKKSLGSMYADGKSIAEDVRGLSYIFECPVISAGQLNRTGYNTERADVTTSGESLGIPQTADAQFHIRRTEAEKELGLLTLSVEKSRFGKNWGSKSFRIDFDTLILVENEGIFENNDEMSESVSILDRLSDEE